LPGDYPCPLGIWLADRISESLSRSHPELEVIPRSSWNFHAPEVETIHDVNQLNAAKARYAKSLGAEVFVRGNFAAIPNGIGITLVADDRLAGGESRFEALAEVPLTNEMKEQQPSPVPNRTLLGRFYRAGTAGIGSPVCEQCAQPRYSYVARAKGLTGVVILEIGVTSEGTTETVTLIRAPDSALATAAIRTVRTWQFKPATNALGEFVPVIMNVAVSFRPSEN
jgi:TonB family protein